MALTKFIKFTLVPIVVLLGFDIDIGKAQEVNDTSGYHKEDKANGDVPEPWVHPPPDQDAAFPVHPFVPGKGAPLISMDADGKLVYKPYSDKGDLVLDWSHCGYKKSEVPIPEVPVVEILHPLSENTRQAGNMCYPVGPDNREQIQAALDRVAARQTGAHGSRGAVLLKKGTYYLKIYNQN